MFRCVIAIILSVPITVPSNYTQSGRTENPDYNSHTYVRCERPIAPRLLIIILDLTIMLLAFCVLTVHRNSVFYIL